MSDVLTPEQRHRNMSHIKSRDTHIEIILRKALWQKGYHYRKNYRALPGTPDIAMTKYKIAIFCDSEFFHGYNWETKKLKIGNNRDYWIHKIESNIARDRENDLKLIALGWTPLHFWGHDIIRRTANCVNTIEEIILDLKISHIITDNLSLDDEFLNTKSRSKV